MNTSSKPVLTVETTIHCSLEKVWQRFTGPEHIVKWNKATDDWHCPSAENDLRTGGRFCYTMAAKDGSFSFDFEGYYTEVCNRELLEYEITDGRKVIVEFSTVGDTTLVVERFEAEDQNPLELQQEGWHAILNSFRDYCESLN